MTLREEIKTLSGDIYLSEEETENKSIATVAGVAAGAVGTIALGKLIVAFFKKYQEKQAILWKVKSARNTPYKGIIYSQNRNKNSISLYIIPTEEFISDYYDENGNIKFADVKKKIGEECEKALKNLEAAMSTYNPLLTSLVKEVNFSYSSSWFSKEQANELKELIEKKAHKVGFSKAKAKLIK